MSTMKKKTKKLRRPNYVAAGLAGSAAEGRGGGAEVFPQPARADGGRPVFDYAYVKKDLRRIGLLSALCVSIIVALSFFLR